MSILKKVIELSNSIQIGDRDNWEEYFMSLAYMASLRATCGSRRVGSVVINGLEPGKRRVLATGYNGNPPGAPHCIEGGCPRFQARLEGKIKSGEYNDNLYYCDASHAEWSALSAMMRMGIPTEGCILFTTTFPCKQCAEKINGAGIKTIYYSEGYPDENSKEYLNRYNIEVIKIEV